MAIRPIIRHFIPCWKEPTITANGPNAQEIMYSIRVKSTHGFPAWQKPYYVLVAMTNLHGPCRFSIELHVEDVGSEALLHKSDTFTVESGNHPLQVVPISVMMKPVELPKPGLYRLCLVCEGEELAHVLWRVR